MRKAFSALVLIAFSISMVMLIAVLAWIAVMLILWLIEWMLSPNPVDGEQHSLPPPRAYQPSQPYEPNLTYFSMDPNDPYDLSKQRRRQKPAQVEEEEVPREFGSYLGRDFTRYTRQKPKW